MLKPFILVVATGGLAVTLTACGAPSYESVADECGGPVAGVAASSTALLVDASETDTVLCVIDGLFDGADEYTVTMLLDAGPGTLVVGGRPVATMDVQGDYSLVIGNP